MIVRRFAMAVCAALLAGAFAPAQAATATADTASHAPLFGRRDVAFAFAASGLGVLAAANDRAWSDRASGDRSVRAHDWAAFGRQLGDPMVTAPVLLAADGLARLAGHDRIGAATERIALSAAGASAVTLVLGQALGRERPDEPPGRARHFAPFSGHDALPSAHTTLAFALATSIASESHARWVPVLLYPAATLTAWSRVHDRRHWPSDVVAGAAVGTWVASKVDRIAQRRLPRGLLVLVWPRAKGAGASVRLAF